MMKPLPHHYSVTAHAAPEGDVALAASGLPGIESSPPAEFGGPGDRWSPESLLMAAVADCFALTFRGIARASKLAWTRLDCHAEGTLDRVDRQTRFVAIRVVAELTVPGDVDEATARRLLQKAEETCLVSNSLAVQVDLDAKITIRG